MIVISIYTVCTFSQQERKRRKGMEWGGKGRRWEGGEGREKGRKNEEGKEDGGRDLSLDPTSSSVNFPFL